MPKRLGEPSYIPAWAVEREAIARREVAAKNLKVQSDIREFRATLQNNRDSISRLLKFELEPLSILILRFKLERLESQIEMLEKVEGMLY